MRGPFKVRLNTGGEVPVLLDIDAESLAYSGGIMLFYRGTRIAYVVGTAQLIDVRGEVEPEPDALPLAIADDEEPDAPVRGDFDEPYPPGAYL